MHQESGAFFGSKIKVLSSFWVRALWLLRFSLRVSHNLATNNLTASHHFIQPSTPVTGFATPPDLGHMQFL
jgi:hypothetical protein